MFYFARENNWLGIVSRWLTGNTNTDMTVFTRYGYTSGWPLAGGDCVCLSLRQLSLDSGLGTLCTMPSVKHFVRQELIVLINTVWKWFQAYLPCFLYLVAKLTCHVFFCIVLLPLTFCHDGNGQNIQCSKLCRHIQLTNILKMGTVQTSVGFSCLKKYGVNRVSVSL